VKNGARISSPGDIRVIGQGGLGSQSGNHGVFVDLESADGVPSAIISTGGVLEIIGNGGGTGNALYNYGVIAWRGGLIQGATNAATKIIGTGGTSAGSHNIGVVVEGISPTNVPSTVKSMGGSLEITGTGGGTENALYNYGVIVNQGGLIQGASSASTGIIGTGGSSAGNVNHGVVVLGVSSTDVPSRITSTGGPLTIEGHGAGTGDSSWNHGVLVKDKAEINGPSGAELTVIGRGGGTTGASTRNYGVVVNNGSAIQSPGGGLISVDGKGGSGSAGYNYGVLVTAASPAGDRSRIHSEGGNVSVTGQGGGNGESLWDFGVILFSHGLISSTGSGNVTVTGTSGQAGGNNQLGVGVNGKTAPAQITSVDGKVTVVGRSLGNGTSGSDDGVELTAGGEISSTGQGDVHVEGFGGQGSGVGNRGVLLYGVADSGQPSRIISSGGSVSVTGTGGGVAGAAGATGVTLQDGGTISGPAEVSVDGTGGLGTGSNHHGVFVRGESAGGVPSTITSTGGALQVIGVGGGSGNSGNNLGICVWLGGLIQGASNATTVLQGTGGASLGARNDGVRIDDISTANRPSTVTSAGGPITITGQGGGSGTSNDNHGVWVVRGGVLAGPTNNPLIVSGTAGSPSGDQNMGIHVSHTRGDIRSKITSSGGDVTLVGEAGGTGTSAFNRGVAVWHGGLVTAGGSGAVSVTGTGGNGGGAFNLGVSVIGTNGDAQITSSGGDVLVQGFGRGTANSIHNRGVEVLHGGVVTAGQTGKLTVEGTGGNGGGSYDIGVLVMGTNPNDQSATITSAGGEIKITGQGGGTGDASNNYGIHVWNGGQLVGPANIHLIGNGGSTRGKFNNGIRIGAYNEPAKVSSIGGSILVEGTGGGIAESIDSSNNYGVAIVQGAEVSVPSGNGRITISGFGGPGGGDWNRGVYVVDQAENGSVSTVTTNAGEIRIVGVGGQTPTSNGNYGIDIALDARLDSGGDMTLVGFGSDPNSISPYGLLIRDPNTTLRASEQILIDALIGVDNVTTDFSATETAWGGGRWQAEISGLTSETEYDQLDIEGKVELGGISLIGDYAFPNGGSVILIDNDGDDPIVGRLYDLTEGSGWVNEGDVVSFNGAMLQVSYQGGDGNDLELTSLNVPPTLDPLSDLQVAEDSGSTSVDLTGISAGNTESQPLRVTAASSNPALIPDPTVAYDWPSDSGSLTLVSQPGQSGSTTIVVTVEDGGFDGDLSTPGDNASFTRTLNVIINPVNDVPTLDGINGLTIDEDAAEQTVNLAGITAGDGETQSLRVTAASGNAGLIPNPVVTYTSANVTGSLTFTPVADQNGTTTITVTVEDGGLDDNLATPGDNASFARTFDVVVNAVNDVPTLGGVNGLTIDEDAAEQTINLAGISAGGGETQPIRVTATSGNAGLIPDPTVTYTSANPTGSLAFTPIANQSGTATITITIEDGGLDGDLATQGDNASFARAFDVVVNSINDVPTLDGVNGLTIDEDAAEQTINLAGISAGGGETQPIRVTATSGNAGLIPDPTVTYTSANPTGSLAFTPIANQSGTATITVTVEDGGLDGDLATQGDNASFARAFDVVVNSINDVPTLDGVNGLTIDEDAAEQTINLAGISAGGGETQPIRVTATSGNAGLIPDPTVIYTSANATGRLALTPVADRSGTATITVTVEDGGLDGDLATPSDNASFSQEFDVQVGRSSFEVFDGVLRLDIREPSQQVKIIATTLGLMFELQHGTWFGVETVGISGNGTSRVEIPEASVFNRIKLIGRDNGQALVFADAGQWQMGQWESNVLGSLRSVKMPDDDLLEVHLNWPRPWQNVINPTDINNDRTTTALDALQIVNELGRRAYTDPSTGFLQDPTELESWPGIYYDQNGDGQATALDALRVINELARNPQRASSEGEAILIAHPHAAKSLSSEAWDLWQEPPSEIHRPEERSYSFGKTKPVLTPSDSADIPQDQVYEAVGKDTTDAVDQLLSAVDFWSLD
jgi:hypothetical protein